MQTWLINHRLEEPREHVVFRGFFCFCFLCKRCTRSFYSIFCFSHSYPLSWLLGLTGLGHWCAAPVGLVAEVMTTPQVHWRLAPGCQGSDPLSAVRWHWQTPAALRFPSRPFLTRHEAARDTQRHGHSLLLNTFTVQWDLPSRFSSKLNHQF